MKSTLQPQRSNNWLITIIALALCLWLCSCSKNHDQCYNCTFGYVNGHKPADREVCGELPTQFTDEAGNPLQSQCTVK